MKPTNDIPLRFEITGQWEGYFEYGQDYEGYVGERVTFNLTIATCKDEEFVGECIDVKGYGAHGQRSTVSGFLEGDLISFTKVYPHLWMLDEDGNQIEFHSLPHAPIHYNGHFDLETNTVYGEWDMWAEVIDENEKIDDYVISGNWAMWKLKDA